MGKLYWTGICGQERNGAITQISSIINRYGCFTDFRLFSDVSLSMVIEVEERKVDALYAELGSYLALEDFPPIHSSSARERVILFHVTFTRGTGNVAREVPAVPG
ncbi:MAG: hypothetical protein ICV83_18130 [Cytophagales bacterium]|nr:hypothetical protein [Cytophagales bacterium]